MAQIANITTTSTAIQEINLYLNSFEFKAYPLAAPRAGVIKALTSIISRQDVSLDHKNKSGLAGRHRSKEHAGRWRKRIDEVFVLKVSDD